jgi:diadenosine tetraphosphatase ApaH/serine/threonine PP2A family protein phosphatase
MLLALLADIHANGPALEAVLADAAAKGAGAYVFLGDLVGYGPDPVAVTERVAAMVGAGAHIVKGNHDEAAVSGTGTMNPTAAAAIAWTHSKLSADARNFLAHLPMTQEMDDLLFVHADASRPAAWNYVTNREEAATSLRKTEKRVTFCGHVHKPALYYAGQTGPASSHIPVDNVAMPLSGPRKWLMVCGAVGQPRDGNPAACYTTYNTATRSMTLHRVAYDAEAVAARIRAEGLPESLAIRLTKGL